LEDAHWIDKDSAAFLSTFLPEPEHTKENLYPLAVLATARYEGHGLPIEGFPFQELNLSELNPANLAALAQTYLDAPPSENLLNLLVERSEGNPFFAEQLLRYLNEAKRLKKVDGEWQVVTLDRSPLPEDVNALLVARLDRLAHTVREVVQTAAVLGREIEVRLLSQMLQGDTSLPNKIAQAEKESIWSALSEIRYIFKHGLLRDAAYRMQLRARRQTLHKLAMEALESLYQDDLSSHFGELAYHALSANLPETAFHYSLAAGNEAMQHYAAAEAVSHYRPAMELFGQMKITTEQRHQLCILYGRAIELTGDPQAAYAHYEYLEKLALEIGDQPLELAALVAQGTLRATGTVLMDNEIAESLSQKSLDLAHTLNDRAAEAKILWNLLNIYLRTNREDEAIAAGMRSYELAESLNLKEQMA
jgi:predicted ATPase